MDNLYTLKSNYNTNAIVSLTNEYLMIQGYHYELYDGFIQTTKESRSINIKDVLQVSFVKTRSRKLLFAFLIPLIIISIIYSIIFSYLNNLCLEEYATKFLSALIQNIDIFEYIGHYLIPSFIVLFIFLLYEIFIIYSYFVKVYHLLKIDYTGGNIAIPYKKYSEECINTFLQKLKESPSFCGCIK